MHTKYIRNFTIIAHIDHGKTTLVDKMLEIIGLKNIKQERVTDTLQIEQEKGITVKMQPITFNYKDYKFNLIDTPGHIDFSYEVSRSLKAVEGAILLVDVTKGIQAQTIENLIKAIVNDLVIIPALSKIDMADENLRKQRLNEIKLILDIEPSEVILTSGHTGKGVTKLLDTIIKKIPTPKHLNQSKALIFDLHYDLHLGMIATIRNFGQTIKPGDKLYLINENKQFEVKEVGIYTPQKQKTNSLGPGEIGYIATGIKDTNQIFIGETISKDKDTTPIPGYKKPKPVVFASIFPQNSQEYNQFKDAILKLALNDTSLQTQEIKSSLLGRGFKIGCLGTLHLEIVKDRLAQEFKVTPIITMPTVEYKISYKGGIQKTITSPNEFPDDTSKVLTVFEPILHADIITPMNYIAQISDVIKSHRGIILDISQDSRNKINLDYYHIKTQIPLASLIEGFFNKLLQASKGYASFSYTKITYAPTQVVKVNILVNHIEYPELAFLTHPQTARQKALKMLQALKQSIPPSIIHIPLQAKANGKFIARETIRAYRKNVTAKLYGGDIRRKVKLLQKQAKLKKKRKEYIKIKIPAKAFLQAVKNLNK